MNPGVLAGIIVFFVGIIAGVPLAWVFLGSSVVSCFILGNSLTFMAGTIYHTVLNYILMAVGFFILAGNLMAQAGLAQRFTRFAYALVGRIKGGLVDVGILASVFLGALTGSSVPCIAALVPLLVPQLEKYGYDKSYTTAVLCSSSFLGYLIPPSVPVLFYCLIAQQSVAALFLSTIIPGLLLAFGYMVLNTFLCGRYMKPSSEMPMLPQTARETIKEIAVSGWSALPALGCPLIVLGGIYGGICTPNEAGAFAVIYTIIVGLFVYREMTFKDMLPVFKNTALAMGMIIFLMAFGMIFTRILVREGVAQSLASLALGLFHSKILILMILNVLLLLMGMFIDGLPIMVVAVPLLLPLVKELDINLVHLGAIVIVNVGLGVVTPPYAMSIFVGSKLADVPYDALVKPMLYFFFLVGVPVLLLTTYIPALSCWLPTVVLGSKIVGPW